MQWIKPIGSIDLDSFNPLGYAYICSLSAINRLRSVAVFIWVKVILNRLSYTTQYADCFSLLFRQ